MSYRTRRNTSYQPTIEELEDRSLLSANPLHAVHPPVLAAAQKSNGSAGDMPALYDGKQLTINFKEQPDKSEQVLLKHNGSINVIYMDETDGFTSVIDAVPGDGF